jgi:hypothetical protein
MEATGQARSRPPPATITRAEGSGGIGRESNAAAGPAAGERKLIRDRAMKGCEIFGDYVAAGDGLLAFGAGLIVVVQLHYWGRRKQGGAIFLGRSGRSSPAVAASKKSATISTSRTPPAAQSRAHPSAFHPPSVTTPTRPAAAPPPQPREHPHALSLTPGPQRRAAAADRRRPRPSRGTLRTDAVDSSGECCSI